jgi:bacterioferritin-associated ferredoxin
VSKVILCRCEDVTLADVAAAIDKGYSDIEEVKRYTGFGTGPCQGKECGALVALALCRIVGGSPAAIAPFTARPPLTPTPLKLFVNDPTAEGTGEDG